MPDAIRTYQSRSKNAQEAHEAIRPTSINNIPDNISQHLTKDQSNLYKLIWERTLASQMTDALLEITTVDIDAVCDTNKLLIYRFRTNGSVVVFNGFRVVYMEGSDDTDNNQLKLLPHLSINDLLEEVDIESKQHFTQPPAKIHRSYSNQSIRRTWYWQTQYLRTNYKHHNN